MWLSISSSPVTSITTRFTSLPSTLSYSIPVFEIPEKDKTEKICEFLIKDSKHNFQYIPDKYKTYQMCLEACKYNAYNIAYTPNKFKTKEGFNVPNGYEPCFKDVMGRARTYYLMSTNSPTPTISCGFYE